MEFLYTEWEKLQTSVRGWVFNYVILIEEMEVLIKKVEDLVSLEKDMNLALDNLERQHGKKRKEEVNIWLEKVQRTKNKVGERVQQVRESRYLPQWWLQWLVRKDIREVSELFEQGKFREGLLISDEDEYGSEVLADVDAEHSEGSISPGYYWTENQSEEDSSESILEEIDLNKLDSSEKGLLTGKSAQVQEDTAEGSVQGLLISDEDEYRGEVPEYSQEVLEDIKAEYSKGSTSLGYYWTENQSEEDGSESIPEEIDLNKLDSSEKGLLTEKSAKVLEDTAEGSVQDIWKYDVFLSFRHTGSRNSFTHHLHKALSDKNIKAFIDMKTSIERGEGITPAIERVIEGANISVIVFSSDYAYSTFCLDELAKIMECRESKAQIVLPIFYKVDPHEELYQEAFATYEAEFQRRKTYREKTIKEEISEMGRWMPAFSSSLEWAGLHTTDSSEKTIKEEISRVERWKSAFSSALELAGWHITDSSDEREVVEKISRQVLTRSFGKGAGLGVTRSKRHDTLESTLGVTRSKRRDTLESTWKRITDGRPIPLTRHLKKSNTWEKHELFPAASLPHDKLMKKSETFNATTKSKLSEQNMQQGSGRLKREPSLSQDELNKRVEAFIKKFNDEMRLQRQQP